MADADEPAQYPEGSAGRVMTPATFDLDAGWTAAEALDAIRSGGCRAKTLDVLPVVGAGRTMTGIVGLADLVMAPSGTVLRDLVDSRVPRVRTTDPAQAAARLMQDQNLRAAPVTDSHDRLVGLLSTADALELIETAGTEDAARQAGADPPQGHYLSVGVLQLARSRATWLLLLIIAATLTVNVMQVFEGTLEEVTALALFIPLLIGTGGNAGAQSASAVVRALAIGEVRPADLPVVVWRECQVGVGLGVLLALVGLVVGSLVVDLKVAIVVALSIVLICAWATTVGAVMPLLAKRTRVDPAVVSAPMVTTLVDATGLIIYFLMARLVLGI